MAAKTARKMAAPWAEEKAVWKAGRRVGWKVDQWDTMMVWAMVGVWVA